MYRRQLLDVFDYIIIGKNIASLAFADTILVGSDATIAIIDDEKAMNRLRCDMATFQYSRVPDESVGIGSYTFEDWRTANHQTNEKSLHRAADLQAYLSHVLDHVILPSKRVQVFDRVEHFGSGRIKSIETGNVRDLLARCSIVDATRLPNNFCKSFIPCFSIAPGVQVVRPFNLDTALDSRTIEVDTFCVLGGGRTGTEMVLTLLDRGVPSRKIRWVKSREPWMLALATKSERAQSLSDQNAIQQECLKAMAYAQNPEDLCLRLETLGVIVRTSVGQSPSSFLPHMVTHLDAERLRQVYHVIGKGHVHAITEIGMVLSRGVVPMPGKALYLDCTGDESTRNPPSPVFQKGRIDLAEIRLCHPSFSAAIIAAIALQDLSIEEKNKLSVPMMGHHVANLFLTSLLNQHAWFHDDNLRTWLTDCRLDSWMQTSARRLNASPRIPQDLSTIRKILPRAIINLESMIQQGNAPAQQII